MSLMQWLWLTPALPLAGALILGTAGGPMARRAAAAIGCAAVGLSWLASMFVAVAFIRAQPSGGAFHQTLFRWIDAGALHVRMGLYLDSLSAVMMCVVAFVAFLIHLYSVGFMAREDGYSRFLCYMNLFVGSMLTLVLADNLLSLYLGWEGVGLCSYLLIGFWYRERANGVAAQKAFIVTRVGDASLAVSLFLIFWHVGSLDLQQAARAAAWSSGRDHLLATAAALLLVGGAVGKSAQLPLQTWLPDAMAGPTPVSALIHAATMVTAGVYLIARTHVLFALSPAAMLTVAVIGAATACYAGFSALAQRDIKRVLAYSTISQIGFMFLALGVGAWAAAIFHLVTHAFFKSLLFLSAGIVVQALDEERDIHRMGGLWRRLPWGSWSFLIGAGSLAALPLVTAGFYSKDAILEATYAAPQGATALWAAGLLAALLTGTYIFRVFFLVFFGAGKSAVTRQPSGLMKAAVGMLSFFAVVGGFVGMPRALGGFGPIVHFLARTLGELPGGGGAAVPLVISSVASLAGVFLGYLFFMRLIGAAPVVARSAVLRLAHRFLYLGWGFDWLYDHLLVRPYVTLARVNQRDFVDAFYLGAARLAGMGNRALSATASGRLRNYATALLLGAVVMVIILVWLR
jgi:NADH-quinone oxidoreductase subunit L